MQTDHHLSESIDTTRVFAKIAFNVLTEIKGRNYALEDAFDPFKDGLWGR